MIVIIASWRQGIFNYPQNGRLKATYDRNVVNNNIIQGSLEGAQSTNRSVWLVHREPSS